MGNKESKPVIKDGCIYYHTGEKAYEGTYELDTKETTNPITFIVGIGYAPTGEKIYERTFSEGEYFIKKYSFLNGKLVFQGKTDYEGIIYDHMERPVLCGKFKPVCYYTGFSLNNIIHQHYLCAPTLVSTHYNIISGHIIEHNSDGSYIKIFYENCARKQFGEYVNTSGEVYKTLNGIVVPGEPPKKTESHIIDARLCSDDPPKYE
jgi:hypothetical protein